MFISAIIGILAGLGFKFAFEPISKALADKVALDEHEKAVFVFAILMGIGAIVASIISSGASPFWLVAGGLLGMFGFRLFAFAKEKAAEARDETKEVVEDVEDAADKVIDSAKEKAGEAKEKVAEVAESVKD